MKYRDLTGDDVLQDGDEAGCANVWGALPDFWIGCRCYEFPGWEFRRPLTPSEITAAERSRFEASMLDLFLQWSPTGFHQMKNGDYADGAKQDKWKVWCAAVNCDPMADVTTD